MKYIVKTPDSAILRASKTLKNVQSTYKQLRIVLESLESSFLRPINISTHGFLSIKKIEEIKTKQRLEQESFQKAHACPLIRKKL